MFIDSINQIIVNIWQNFQLFEKCFNKSSFNNRVILLDITTLSLKPELSKSNKTQLVDFRNFCVMQFDFLVRIFLSVFRKVAKKLLINLEYRIIWRMFTVTLKYS